MGSQVVVAAIVVMLVTACMTTESSRSPFARTFNIVAEDFWRVEDFENRAYAQYFVPEITEETIENGIISVYYDLVNAVEGPGWIPLPAERTKLLDGETDYIFHLYPVIDVGEVRLFINTSSRQETLEALNYLSGLRGRIRIVIAR